MCGNATLGKSDLSLHMLALPITVYFSVTRGCQKKHEDRALQAKSHEEKKDDLIKSCLAQFKVPKCQNLTRLAPVEVLNREPLNSRPNIRLSFRMSLRDRNFWIIQLVYRLTPTRLMQVCPWRSRNESDILQQSSRDDDSAIGKSLL
jgi:hypothetical protein